MSCNCKRRFAVVIGSEVFNYLYLCLFILFSLVCKAMKNGTVVSYVTLYVRLNSCLCLVFAAIYKPITVRLIKCIYIFQMLRLYN